MSGIENVKKTRGRPKRELRKFGEIRPNIPNPNTRMFLRAFTVSTSIEKRDLKQLDTRAKELDLNRAEFLRCLIFQPVRAIISKEEYTEFMIWAKDKNIDEYMLLRRLIHAYLIDYKRSKKILPEV